VKFIIKEVNAMNESVNNQHNIEYHIDQQRQFIEHTLNVLLRDISMEDLTTNQRLNFAAKILLPYVRILALQYSMQRAQQPATEEEAFFGELRQQLRLSLEEVTVDAAPSQDHSAP
jgi:hypothetical protein